MQEKIMEQEDLKEDYVADLISRKLTHDTEPEFLAAFENWKTEKEENRKLCAVFERIEPSPLVAGYVREAHDGILVKLNAKMDKMAIRLRWLGRAAGAVAATVLLGFTGYISYDAGFKRQNSQLVTLENPLGMKSSIVLPDGSKVTLNAGSVLTYPNAFVAKERRVFIRGEGFFEVTGDTGHPFVVATDDIQIKVLGTKFNVKAYGEEDYTEVTLSEGSVSTGLAGATAFITMEAGQQVIFDRYTKHFSKRTVNLDNYTAWKDGKFCFSDVTFENIARQLERKFNVHIHIDTWKLRNTRFSGDFVRGENLEQILRVMTRDKRIKYTICEDQIYME